MRRRGTGPALLARRALLAIVALSVLLGAVLGPEPRPELSARCDLEQPRDERLHADGSPLQPAILAERLTGRTSGRELEEGQRPLPDPHAAPPPRLLLAALPLLASTAALYERQDIERPPPASRPRLSRAPPAR